MGWSRQGSARISATHPQAIATCDFCGFVFNRKDLQWAVQWQGTTLQNLGFLVCPACWDKPNPQLKTIILPPDPIPIWQPREEPYSSEVPTYRVTQDGNRRVTEGGEPRVTEGISPDG